MRSLGFTLGFLVLSGCGSDSKSENEENKKRTLEGTHDYSGVIATAEIEGLGDQSVSGKAIFTEKDGMVVMNVRISNVEQGLHAIHIHEHGDCSTPDGSTAGGHWNPIRTDHGEWRVDPFHRGDIGNIAIDEDGIGVIGRETDLWCIGCDNPNKNIVGKSVIIHSGADDFTSQPSGASGTRIACGIITKR